MAERLQAVADPVAGLAPVSTSHSAAETGHAAVTGEGGEGEGGPFSLSSVMPSTRSSATPTRWRRRSSCCSTRRT